MRKPIEIGGNKFIYKKDALEFYKKILNSYECGEQLKSPDFISVYGLIEIHSNKKKELIGRGIKYLKVGKAKFNTKSFEIVRQDGSCEFLTYTKRINKPKDQISKFSIAC